MLKLMDTVMVMMILLSIVREVARVAYVSTVVIWIQAAENE